MDIVIIEIDKRLLHDKLTGMFIEYQHRIDCPMPSRTETKASVILKYRSDPLFHAKVDSLVSSVMWAIETHLEPTKTTNNYLDIL